MYIYLYMCVTISVFLLFQPRPLFPATPAQKGTYAVPSTAGSATRFRFPSPERFKG